MIGSHRSFRKWFFLLVLVGCFVFAAVCWAEGAFPLLGDWAFNYEPTVCVLTIRDDGTAHWNGSDYCWESDEFFLRLENEQGEIVFLRYQAEGDKVQIFIPATYTRTAKDKDEEIFGAWLKDGSYGSSFVFEKDMRFMEDGTFVGTFELDPENASFTLKYQPHIFEDTKCYFEQEGDRMTIDYPWTIVPVEEDKVEK